MSKYAVWTSNVVLDFPKPALGRLLGICKADAIYGERGLTL